jgi:adenylate kinase
MKLIFLGPPGAGKGTLAGLVSKELGVPHISTGDIFRDAIKRGTELGNKVKEIVGRGDLVPDELTVSLVRERLSQPDAAKGFIFDGFPRVVNFRISDDEVVRRLSGRRVCRNCGSIFNVDNVPPKKEGICDACGGPLYIRDDDSVHSIKNRLDVYKNQTEPLIAFYEKKKLLRNVDSSRTPADTLGQFRKTLPLSPSA